MLTGFQSLRPPFAAARNGRKTLVVVGNGMVSHRLCQKLFAHPAAPGRYRMVVIGEEPVPAYDRVRLSESLDHGIEHLLLDPVDWYKRQGIELHLGALVERIDREQKAVCIAGGKTIAYDQLVLATGSTPFVPPVPGIEQIPIFVYRTVADTERIRSAAAAANRAAVIGGGLLGLEAARVLKQVGVSVVLIEQGSSLMPRQLDADSGAFLDLRIRAQGLETCLGERLAEVGSAGGAVELRFASGGSRQVDLVVAAAGIRPRDELARAAGLRTGTRGGVIIDDRLRTSDRNIYAVGECAVHRGRHYGLVAPGYAMADVLAAQLCDQPRRFRRGDLSCHLKLLDVPVSAVGTYDQEARLVTHQSGDERRTLLLDGRRLIGATAVGPWPQLTRVHDLVLREERLSERRLLRFVQTGELWDDAERGVAQWPARTSVCNCVGVTRGELSQCIAAGLTTADELAAKTGAGSVCGSCKPLLGELVGTPLQARVPGRLAVAWASVLSLLLLSSIVFVPGLPVAASVDSALHRANALLQDPSNKQLTGYSLVGVSLLGTLLSARKRLAFFRFGGFGWYRALHTSASAAATAMLCVHTGFRAGTHLNFMLLFSFVGLSLLGAAAGMASALESGTGQAASMARRSRPTLTLIHILLLWPLPVLLGLHVFSAYYF